MFSINGVSLHYLVGKIIHLCLIGRQAGGVHGFPVRRWLCEDRNADTQEIQRSILFAGLLVSHYTTLKK